MAPNGHKPASRRSARQSDINSVPEWLKIHGKDEYKRWCIEHPSQRLTYDEWRADGQNLHGLALFYATKNLIDNDSSDDEPEPVEAKSRPRVVRTQSAREPKKKVTANGSKLPRASLSTASSPLADSGSVSPSGKRKRKPPRKFLSEEIIASDEDSDEELNRSDPPTVAEHVATPTAPVSAVSGRRKSSSRRPRKKPISDETISPEDELDDPMVIDAIAAPAIASPLPVRSAAPKAATVTRSPPSPKKTHILKLSTRRNPMKKTDSEDAPGDRTGVMTTPMKPDAANESSNAKSDTTSSATMLASGHNSPDDQPTSTADSPDAASTRRGLRTRKPAQQRPYYHDAQLFEDAEPIVTSKQGSEELSPGIRSRRMSIASLSRGVDDELLAALDEETIALLQEEDENGLLERKPKHFKGKGRAWKKEESDEDEEFTLAKKKAAKAAKVKTEAKKRGRPRKSVQTEEIVQDTSDMDTAPRSPSSPRSGSKEAPKRKRAAPRKSVLSAEIIQDSSDLDEDQPAEATQASENQIPRVSTPPSKKKALSSKTDESGAETVAESTNLIDSSTMFKRSPLVSTTQTPKGTPRSLRLTISLPQEPTAQKETTSTKDNDPTATTTTTTPVTEPKVKEMSSPEQKEEQKEEPQSPKKTPDAVTDAATDAATDVTADAATNVVTDNVTDAVADAAKNTEGDALPNTSPNQTI